MARRVRSENLSYLGLAALLELREEVRKADRAGRVGAVVECGCALGGSAIVMASSRKDTSRPVYVYDVFAMIPPPSDKDGSDVVRRYQTISSGQASGLRGDRYYGYHDDLEGEVARSFEKFGLPPQESQIHLVKGLFQDTLQPEWPVALAHVDGDWYESVAVCLERLWPALVPGGTVVIDDYFDWSGCRRAVDDFLSGREDVRRAMRTRLHLIKTR